MAKSLGQIHTVNNQMIVSGAGNRYNIDLAGQLTEQLQTLVRAGTYHKIVGIDMTLTAVGTVGGGQVTGEIRYFAPTRGRCEAFRGAFKSMKEIMKTQGIDMTKNKMYDFKAPINDFSGANLKSGAFPNNATLDGVNGLALRHDANDGASIFGVHNRSVQPQFTGTAGDMYTPGFDTILQSNATGTDFVLNDTIPYTGSRDFASLEYESIPFSLSYTPDTTDLTLTVEWRPDPALFLAVMCGQLQVVVNELNLDGGAGSLELNIATMVSGWKSIMGDPTKARRSRSSASKKTEADKKK
jgi:hypothetical protein